ncbi:hypothetical protein QR680_010850 [Steinernema hermaphroditum]|uniref:G-protein coupled receptors family 1 profile domain-containing protein n=1 Tax=Steinernema hermaphroditum TaxID=289476 RepID=A0AA39ISS9_9BILA|nr:hypothetical protein QR680_010850 [Steinernema hermaphroditum]
MDGEVFAYLATGIAPEMRCITLIYRFVISVMLMPVYVRILWSLLSKKKFRSNVAYLLIVNIGITDIFFLLTVFWAAIMSVRAETIGHTYLQGITTAACFYRCLYFMAYFTFSLLLAVNRLLVINECTIVPDKLYKLLMCVAWLIIAVVFPFLFVHYELETEYDVDFAMLFSMGYILEDVVHKIEVPLYICICATYLILVLGLVVKRKKLRQKLRISSPEGRLALQTVFLFVPQGVVFIFMMLLQTTSLQSNLENTLLFYAIVNPKYIVAINIVNDLLPLSYLSVLVAFNTEIRKVLKIPCGSTKTVKIYVAPNSRAQASQSPRTSQMLIK